MGGRGPLLSAFVTWTSSFQKCAEIIVAHLGYLNYTQYRVTVGFEHLNQPIKDMNFTVSVRPALSFCRSLVRWFDASGPCTIYFGKPVF